MPLRILSDKEKSVLYLHLECHYSVNRIVKLGGVSKFMANQIIEKYTNRYLEIVKVRERHDINFLSKNNTDRPEFGTHQIIKNNG